jgi:Glycosyl hydrolase family 26
MTGTGGNGGPGIAGATGSAGAGGMGGMPNGGAGSPGIAGTKGSGGVAGGMAGASGTSGSTGGGGMTGVAGTSGSAGQGQTGGAPGAAGGPGSAGHGGTTGTAGHGGSTGAAGRGGASGTAGTSGSAGANGSAGMSGAAGVAGGCSAVPVTPNATQQAKNVLCYLYSQYGNHILSGQEENATGQPSGNDVEINYIFQTTGKYPAIRSFDVNNAGDATRCLTWWQANGLCMFGYHMGAPSTADGYTGSMTAVSGGIDSVLTPGTPNNTVFNQRLDNVVNQVAQVQSGKGVVILRLFHEAGGTWFWWSKESGAQYVRLWEYAFNYITNTKGMTGILWLLPYDGTPQASFYPGAKYVDLAGADTYNNAYDYSPVTSIFNATRTIAGTTIPIALHENGPIPDPDQLQTTKTNWLFFNTWTAPYPENDTSVAELQKVYDSTYVITRDEMPSLK